MSTLGHKIDNFFDHDMNSNKLILNKLMIGDWVQKMSLDHIWYNHQITLQDFLKTKEANYLPIPLDPDHLKANGFVECTDQQNYQSDWEVRAAYKFEVDDGLITTHVDLCQLEEFGTWIFGVDNCLWQGVSIEYVHELQHALRLYILPGLADGFSLEKPKNKQNNK